ncbi:hypothetical protein KAR48_18835 [bacterium]|nr:hypothetical protein [bacterium]
MPEPLKNLYNKELITSLCCELELVYGKFDSEKFIEAFIINKIVNMGENLVFSFVLHTKKRKLGKLRIEYAIDFMKNNGRQSRKTFKISESDFSGQKKIVIKKYSFRKISTRKYYSGIHGLAVIINGHELICGNFQLNEKP